MVGKNDRSGVARSRGQGINRTCISTRGVSFRVSRKYLKFVPRTPTRCARYSALIFSFFFFYQRLPRFRNFLTKLLVELFGSDRTIID